MHRSMVNLAVRVAPPVVAFIAVTRSASLTEWANHHEATLLLTLFALVGSLLHPQLRHLVITTLCYGVSFLAARDISFTLGLPSNLNSSVYSALRMGALGTISVLTFCAAVGESISPGTVWARRCYFGGASLYFFGTGFVNFSVVHSWQSVMMLITGMAALGGSIFADRIVQMEKEDDDDFEDEIDLQEQKRIEHKQRLHSKEWVDPANSS